MRAAERRKVLRQRRGLLERTELRHLRDELGVLHRLERILILELRREQLQKVILRELLPRRGFGCADGSGRYGMG